MRKVYITLRITLWSLIGYFIGCAISKFYDYKTRPDWYLVQSAPWYLGIEIQAVITGLIALGILLVMWRIRRKENFFGYKNHDSNH